MVYNNFIIRLLTSVFFILIYSIISLTNFNLVFYIILLIYLLILVEIYLYFIKLKILALCYLALSFIFFLFIDFNNTSFVSFNLFILVIIFFDIFSYLFGKSIGKNKLINISPNKTIEGFIGGYIITLLLSIFTFYFFDSNFSIYTIILIFILILSAFIGDIIESFFKRKNNLKNSSELIPGHGGVFDRFDSFLFSIIIYSVSINL